jgi:hypothetical protein
MIINIHGQVMFHSLGPREGWQRRCQPQESARFGGMDTLFARVKETVESLTGMTRSSVNDSVARDIPSQQM